MAKILVVDDDIGVRVTMELILKKEGHEIVTATNGLEALEVLEKDNFDLIVTDVMMPKMNGIDFMRAFKTKEGGDKTPILAVSGGGNMHSVDDTLIAAEIMSDFFLKKPFTAEELIAGVKSLLS